MEDKPRPGHFNQAPGVKNRGYAVRPARSFDIQPRTHHRPVNPPPIIPPVQIVHPGQDLNSPDYRPPVRLNKIRVGLAKLWRFRRRAMAPTIVIILLVMIGLIYTLWIPSAIISSYKSNVARAYYDQVSKMQAVYGITSSPIFTNPKAQANESKDVSGINSLINQAKLSTNKLSASNHFTILPETSQQISVKRAVFEQSGVNQHIANSRAFLSDCSSLLSYMQEGLQISQGQLLALASDLQTLAANSKSNNLTSLIGKTSSDLQIVNHQLSLLNPPASVKSFNSDLMNTLSSTANNFSRLAASPIKPNIQSNVTSLESSLVNLTSQLNSMPNVVASQLTALETDWPL